MKVYILAITPQTNVRTVQADKVLFQIPEHCPINCGRPRKKNKLDIEGCPHCLNYDSWRRKKRIERYNLYKQDLLAEAHLKRFVLPLIGASVMFYLPIPIRWRNPQREAAHNNWHQRKPDLKNLLTAFEDGLIKADEGIAYYSGLGKKWVDSEQGWIEIKVPGEGRPSRSSENEVLISSQ